MKHPFSFLGCLTTAAACAAVGFAALSLISFVHAQESAALTIVQPANDATQVPTNSGLTFRLESPLYIDDSDPQLSGAFLLRDPSGTSRNLAPQLVRTAPSAVWLVVEPLELRSNTRYEVLSRLVVDDTEGVSQLRLQEEYAPLSAFETGSGADEQAPMFAIVGEPTVGDESCSYVVEVSGTDDETAEQSLFFQTEEDSLGSPNPRVTISAYLQPDEEGPTVTRPIWARDAAGNLSEAQQVELEACTPFDISALGCDVGPECLEDEDDQDSGCSVAPSGTRSRGSAPTWTGLLLLGAALCGLGFRRRCR